MYGWGGGRNFVYALRWGARVLSGVDRVTSVRWTSLLDVDMEKEESESR